MMLLLLLMMMMMMMLLLCVVWLCTQRCGLSGCFNQSTMFYDPMA
jgi:hypothetical protein